MASAKGIQRNSKKSEANQVRYTGDWSSDSKLSCINNGYWEDPFFRFFNNSDPEKIRRTSLICRGYYVRFRICDYFLRSVLRSSNTPMQVVNLGCGMDTLYFRLLPELESKICAFYELDFKSVITAKKSIILHNEILRLMSIDKLFLLSCDLRNIESLHDALQNANFDFGKPTIFYSECVVNYLGPNESNAILQYLTLNIPNAIWLAYEQCYPHDAFGQMMVSHFLKNGCPLLSLLSAPDPKSQNLQLQNAGFESSHIFNAWDCFVQIGYENPPHFPPTNKHQQFDEYEALLATCLHYTVRIGSVGRLGRVEEFLSRLELQISMCHGHPSDQSIVQYNTIDADNLTNEEFSFDIDFPTNAPKLSGHTAVWCTETNRILIFGGVGETGIRMKHLIETEYVSDDHARGEASAVNSRIVAENSLYYERIFSQAVYIPPTSGMDVSGNNVFIFGGRKSPHSPCKNDLVCLNVANIDECKEVSSLVRTSETEAQAAKDSSRSSEPLPRWRFGMVLYYQKGFPILVLFGGRNSEQIFGDCWWYSILKSTWTQHIDINRSDTEKTACYTQPTPRHSHAMVSDIFLGRIFVVGGVSSDDVSLCTDAFWEFRWEWASWKKIPQYSFVSRRIGHSVEVHKRKLYIIGGYAADSFYSLHHFITIIDLDSTVVKTYNYNFFPQHRFLPFGFSTCMLHNTDTKESRIVVFGGGGNCFSFGTFYNKIFGVLTIKG